MQQDQDPFKLKNLLSMNLFPGLYNVEAPPGPDTIPGGTPPAPVPTDVLEPMETPLGAAASAAVGPQVTQRRTESWRPAKLGTANLTGLGDLINNLSFQRLWEGFNPGKLTDDQGFDWVKALTQDSGITRHQGGVDDGAGWLWGYVDPTWLPGYEAPRKVVTITDVVKQMIGGGGSKPFVSDKVPDPTVPYQQQPYHPDTSQNPMPDGPNRRRPPR